MFLRNFVTENDVGGQLFIFYFFPEISDLKNAQQPINKQNTCK